MWYRSESEVANDFPFRQTCQIKRLPVRLDEGSWI